MSTDGVACPRCGKVTYLPEDAFSKYCGNCHQFWDDSMLAIWVVFWDPSDYPGRYVVRVQHAGEGVIAHEASPVIVAYTLEQARTVIPLGLHRQPHLPEDDVAILESYF